MIYADLGLVLTNLRKADILQESKHEACRNYGVELSTGRCRNVSDARQKSTRRFSKFSTVLKSFVLATFAEKAGRAMEGLSLFSLCLSCKELLWTRGGVMKGALGGGKEGGGGELHCYLFLCCPCCFDKRVKGGKRGMKYRAMKVRNEEPSPLSFYFLLVFASLALLLSGFSFQGAPLHFDWVYRDPATICVQSPNTLRKHHVSRQLP